MDVKKVHAVGVKEGIKSNWYIPTAFGWIVVVGFSLRLRSSHAMRNNSSQLWLCTEADEVHLVALPDLPPIDPKVPVSVQKSSLPIVNEVILEPLASPISDFRIPIQQKCLH